MKKLVMLLLCLLLVCSFSLTAFAAGEAPDISYMFSGGSFVKPYIDAGYLLPIDDYLNPDTKSKDLTEEEVVRIREEVSKYLVEGDLRREVGLNIKNKMEIGSYQGIRHRKGLPVRGQRTNRNARTRKGKGKTVANKKK